MVYLINKKYNNRSLIICDISLAINSRPYTRTSPWCIIAQKSFCRLGCVENFSVVGSGYPILQQFVQPISRFSIASISKVGVISCSEKSNSPCRFMCRHVWVDVLAIAFIISSFWTCVLQSHNCGKSSNRL